MTKFTRQRREHYSGDGWTLEFLLWLPPGYDREEARRWPLMLFLHGAGERGNDLSLVASQGLPKQIEAGFSPDMIVVAPQCPDGRRWEPDRLAALLDHIERELSVDADRIYVTGMSMGGYATWALALACPRRFAAIVPVCAGGDPSAIGKLRDLPVWAFHGAKDDVVPLARGEAIVEALRRAGGNVRFTVYPDAGHDSWTETYANPALYDWLLAQRRA